MLPSARAFAAAADALGIEKDDTVVVYDRLGAFSAPRAWWMWHVFGHERCVFWGEGRVLSRTEKRACSQRAGLQSPEPVSHWS